MYFSVMVICVCCVMSCTEIVLSQEFFCAKKTCLVANHGSDLWQYVYMYVFCMYVYIYIYMMCSRALMNALLQTPHKAGHHKHLKVMR